MFGVGVGGWCEEGRELREGGRGGSVEAARKIGKAVKGKGGKGTLRGGGLGKGRVVEGRERKYRVMKGKIKEEQVKGEEGDMEQIDNGRGKGRVD